MPNFLNLKWLKRFFNKGLNKDIVPDSLPEGYYRDAVNVRPVSTGGETGALQGILGETVLYPPSVGLSYVCIGAVSINGHVVEFWASPIPGQYPVIRIDGVIMVQSEFIPYTHDRPLQIATQERCGSRGVVFPVDGMSVHLFWDIGRIIDAFNSGSQEFFTGFNIDTVSVGLSANANFFVPVGDAIVDLGAGGGLPVGQYSYAPRYVDVNGNRTNFGPETAYIPVPFNYDPAQSPASPYPGAKTVTQPADPALPTRYGIRIELRIDNYQGFPEIEIKRSTLVDGAPLGTPPVEMIVARIPIQPNQVGVLVFTDPTGSNVLEVLGPDDVQVSPSLDMYGAKSVEFADKRLSYANFKTDTKVAPFVFSSFSNFSPITAITRKLTKEINGTEVPDGYFNPRLAATRMKYMSGESYGFGIMPWTRSLARGPAISISDSFTFPNRRDKKGAAGLYGSESLTYSDDPCYSADVNNDVGETFECMTQGSVKKNDFINVINFVAPPNAFRNLAAFNMYSTVIDPSWNSYVSGGDIFINNYYPWRPTDIPGTADSYRIPLHGERMQGAAGGSLSGFTVETGNIHAPTYHALGALVAGVTNIPSWVKAISVVRTEPAMSVVCSGIGVYDLVSRGLANTADKTTNALICSFPDIEKGIVPQATIEDMIQNPGSYKVRMVSPQGLFTETFAYSGEEFDLSEVLSISPYVAANMGAAGRGTIFGAWAQDMISYARVMFDSGQVNAGDGGTHGFQPPFGSPAAANQVGFAAWRNDGSTLNGNPGDPNNYSYWMEGTNDGNSLLNITSFVQRTSESRGQSWRLETSQYIYVPSGNTTNNFTAFGSPSLRKFHQPVYIIQIVRDGATVPDTNLKPYINTYTHVVLDSCIGIYDGVNTQFRLVGERWEDCTNYLDTDFRYIYITQPDGKQKIYCAITNNSYLGVPANLLVALTDIASPAGYWIAPDGTHVNGFYETSSSGNDHFVNLTAGFLPQIGSRVRVKYDPDAPIAAFGGDATVAPSVFCPIDRVAYRDPAGARGFEIGGLPLPYAGFLMNPRYLMPEQGDTVEEQIKIDWCLTIRQWAVMFDCETRHQTAFPAIENSVTTPAYQSQSFAPINYINRAYHLNSSYTSAAQYGFWASYDTDYPGETSIWSLGGFRFQPEVNYDYAKTQLPNFIGLPEAGFVERLNWCGSIAASNKFEPQQVDMPNLRTFMLSNVKDLSEETGEIKVIKSGRGPDGNEMNAWTHGGVCKIPTDRSVISNVDGSVLGTQSIDGYWGAEVWLSRNIGLPDEMWRLWTHGPAPPSYADTFFWPDRNAFYMMSGSSIRDITVNRISSRVKPLLSTGSIGTGYTEKLTAVYDPKYNEVLFSIGFNPGVEGRTVLVYNALNGEWTAEYTYAFDEYLCHNGNLLGMREMTTYLTDSGSTINGTQITGHVTTPMTDGSGDYQEFCRFKVYGDKPESVEILDKDGVIMTRMDQSQFGPNWVKDYDGWENWVARCWFPYSSSQRLVQDNLFFIRLNFRGGNRPTFKFTGGQLKKIK